MILADPIAQSVKFMLQLETAFVIPFLFCFLFFNEIDFQWDNLTSCVNYDIC